MVLWEAGTALFGRLRSERLCVSPQGWENSASAELSGIWCSCYWRSSGCSKPVEKFTSRVVPGACVIRQGFEGFTAGQKAAPPPFNDAWKQPRYEHFGVLVVGHNWSPMLPCTMLQVLTCVAVYMRVPLQ